MDSEILKNCANGTCLGPSILGGQPTSPKGPKSQFLRVNLKGQQNAWGCVEVPCHVFPDGYGKRTPTGYRISFLLAFLDLEEAQKLDPAPSLTRNEASLYLGRLPWFPLPSTKKDPWDGTIYLSPFPRSSVWPFFTVKCR